MFYGILERKNALLHYKNRKLKKLRNWDFSKGGKSIVLLKNYQFFHLFILGKKGQKNVFYGIL